MMAWEQLEPARRKKNMGKAFYLNLKLKNYRKTLQATYKLSS